MRLARPLPPPTAITDFDYESTAQTVAMAAATTAAGTITAPIATTLISKR